MKSFIPCIFMLTLILFSCNQNPESRRSDEKKSLDPTIFSCDNIKQISVDELPVNYFKTEEKFDWYDDKISIPYREKSYRIILGNTSLNVKKFTYSFDTVINKVKMRLLIHRNVTDGFDQKRNLLDDVNFFLNELYTNSCYLKDLFQIKDNFKDMGDMLFYDEISVNKENPDKLIYQFIYCWSAGGGSSLKGEELSELTIDEYQKLSNLPTSSGNREGIGEPIISK